jgi:hypothetical protein
MVGKYRMKLKAWKSAGKMIFFSTFGDYGRL